MFNASPGITRPDSINQTNRLKRLIKQARTAPFFQQKLGDLKLRAIQDLEAFTEKVPVTRLEELLAEKTGSGDLYSGRWCGSKAGPLIVFQTEYDTGSALYLGLDRADLQSYANALTRCWALLGLVKGDKVAIFDYGTSPISYLASSLFTPYLRHGAADVLGCLPVCNDGVANMAHRAVEILEFVRPRFLFVRSDCLQPLIMEISRKFPRPGDFVKALVVAENEGLLTKETQASYERRLGVPIYRLLRIDMAMFLAVECPECRLLHSWRDSYFLEHAADRSREPSADHGTNYIVVTNCFAKRLPTLRYLSHVKGVLEPSACPRGPDDQRIATR